MERRKHDNGGTVTTRVICAVCFLAFTFLWLYEFQADLLAVAQHVLSGGVTHYNRTVGAIIITAVLFLLQLAVYAVTRLSHRAHALTYAPSFLALTFLSDINVNNDNSVEVGRWWWLLVIMIPAWIGAVWLARQMLPFSDTNKRPSDIFSARTWMNLVQMAAMMLFVAFIGNTNAVLHFRAHAETALLRGDNHEAIRVGWESLETDRHLTMLRAYALSREGLLGEKLFCYPVAGSADDLLPMRSKPLLLPADSIWRHLGGKPAFPMKAHTYYQLLEADSLATPAVADYALCGKLIDRDLKGFARLLPHYYDISPTLPRHYREALVIYKHKYPNKIGFQDANIEEEWLQLQKLKEQYPIESERRVQVLEKFRNTYWHYYESK